MGKKGGRPATDDGDAPRKSARGESVRANPMPLVELHRGPHVSQSSVQHTLAYVREHGLPSVSGRNSQRRARQIAVADKSTPFGPILLPVDLPCTDGPTPVHMIDPIPLLWRTVRDCPSYAALLREALLRYPCSVTEPWAIIIYFDEVSPSADVQGGVDGREVQCMYWSFAQFGALLYHEDVWNVVVAIRSDLINHELPGGMSRIVAMALRRFFGVHNIEKAGVVLSMQSGEAVISVRSCRARCLATIGEATTFFFS